MSPPPGAAPTPLARRDLLAAAGLFTLAAAAYAPAVGCGFVNFDDWGYVSHNPHVLGGLSAAGVRWAATTDECANWHPLTWVSLQADAAVWGADPAGYHLTNVLLHAANTALVYVALRRLTGAAGRSAAAAALWGLHPLHVESVAWVSERKDVLCGFFWLLTVIVYAWHAAAPGRGRTLAVAAVFALALAAKPMAVTLPFALLLLDCWPLGRLRRPADLVPLASEKAYLFLLAAAAALATLWAQGGGGAVRGTHDVTWADRVSNAAAGYTAYLGMTAWPVNLSVSYPLPAGGRPAWQTAGAVALLIVVTAAAWRLRRTAPYLIVGWLWFLGTLVPVIGLVQVGAQAYADRYTYLPHVGLFAAAVWAAADLANRFRVPVWGRAAAVAAVLAGLTALTVRQEATWRNSNALWGNAVAADPGNAEAWLRLGWCHFADGNWADAARCADEALRLSPDDFESQSLRATARARLDRDAGGGRP